jgi:hypothetical protein
MELEIGREQNSMRRDAFVVMKEWLCLDVDRVGKGMRWRVERKRRLND